MKAAPSATFEVPKTNFLLELLVVAFDTPPQLGVVDQTMKRDIFG
jgi:hypothetical protein